MQIGADLILYNSIILNYLKHYSEIGLSYWGFDELILGNLAEHGPLRKNGAALRGGNIAFIFTSTRGGIRHGWPPSAASPLHQNSLYLFSRSSLLQPQAVDLSIRGKPMLSAKKLRIYLSISIHYMTECPYMPFSIGALRIAREAAARGLIDHWV